MGLKEWFEKRGVSADRVTELKWWEDVLKSSPALDEDKIRHSEDGGTVTTPITIQVEQTRPVKKPSTRSPTDNPRPGLEVELVVSGSGPIDYPFLATRNAKNASKLCRVPTHTVCSLPPKISEMEASGSTSFQTRNDTTIRFACTPAQHNSGRGVCRNKTLWASWYLETVSSSHLSLKVFFGGDTGYRSEPGGPVCPIFREITARYGSPDLAFLPLAAGSVLPFLEQLLPIRLDHALLTSSIHCTPQDAVDIHDTMGAKRSVGIHWGTFTTSQHAAQTVKQVLSASNQAEQSSDTRGSGRLELVDVGAVQCISLA